MVTLETATAEEKNQAKEIGEYFVEKLKQSFTLYKIIKEYYYCFIDNKREEFDIILDSLNYKMFPLARKEKIKDFDEYFNREVNKILNESTNSR